MTLDESKQILRAIGRKSPNLMEAIALFVENHKVEGGYVCGDNGRYYADDDAETTLKNVAALFREMGNAPSAGGG